MRLEFGEWLPDLPDYENPGSLTATNCIPEGQSYSYAADQSSFTGALSEYCRGAISCITSDNAVFTLAGDRSALYLLESGMWTNVSNPEVNYTLADTRHWEFIQYGDAVIGAGRLYGKMQYMQLGVHSQFSSLSGGPNAEAAAVIGDFLVVGSTKDATDGVVRNRVRWPGIGTYDSWDVSAATQADYQDLPIEYGPVKKIVGGEVGYIFQERAITRMSYVGSPTVFQFDTVEPRRGAINARSVVQVGGLVYYLSHNGFNVFDGVSSKSIGDDRVNNTFTAAVNNSYIHRVEGKAHPTKKLIYWCYPTLASSDGTPDRILVYNYSDEAKVRWTEIQTEVEALWDGVSQPLTLDELDTINTSLDNLTESLDSRFYLGEGYFLGSFNTSHQGAKFTGPALTATIETRETAIPNNRRYIITRMRPVVENATTATMEIGSRNKLDETVSWSGSISEQSNGSYPTRTNARYVRAKVTLTGEFTNAFGVDVDEMRQGGSR